MREGTGERPYAEELRKRRPDLWANYVVACYRTASQQNNLELCAKYEQDWPTIITDEVKHDQTHETAGAV
jgi:hypothetical protein